MRSATGVLLLSVAGRMAGADALAAYPESPIRMIVPSAAGGQPDINCRLVAGELTRLLGQQFVVDDVNKDFRMAVLTGTQIVRYANLRIS